MRSIDADALKESVSNSPLIDFDDYDIFELIDNAPTVETPHGKWVMVKENNISMNCFRCTNCNFIMNNSCYNYCPNCGAEMRGDET